MLHGPWTWPCIIILRIPYSEKVWWGESLANLAKLAKLQVIRQIKPSKLSIQNSSVAKLLDVAQSDAGTYRCTARYLFGKEEIDISLVVLSKCRVEGKIYIYIYIYICIHTYISNLCKCCCFISLKIYMVVVAIIKGTMH